MADRVPTEAHRLALRALAARRREVTVADLEGESEAPDGGGRSLRFVAGERAIVVTARNGATGRSLTVVVEPREEALLELWEPGGIAASVAADAAGTATIQDPPSGPISIIQQATADHDALQTLWITA